MDESTKPEDNLADEFRTLGKNLVEALHTAWESPERKRLQQEIEEGLSDLATTLKQEAAAFRDSPAGQRLRTDVEDFRQRVRSGEAEAQVRTELLNTLRAINLELQKASSRWGESEGASEMPSAEQPSQEK